MNSCLFPRKLLVENTIRTADFAVLFLFDKGKTQSRFFLLRYSEESRQCEQSCKR